ncbi:MAG TPA: NUDIX hydrolase, partial [Candidatus Lustribacter sp.]|nr:NUDIX hydrolase [Candidatus Lustribacter sp.]
LARRINASGLRLRKHKGEQGIGRFVGVPIDGGATADIDLVASTSPSPEAVTGAAAVLASDLEGSVLLVHSVRRGTWDCPGGRREEGERVVDCARREVLEETGLGLEESELGYAGYERLTVTDPGHWAYPSPFVQVFQARLGLLRPQLAVGADDVDGARWVSERELDDLCSRLFWWPLARHLLSREPRRSR